MTRRRTTTALVATAVVIAGLVGVTQFVGRPQAEPVVQVLRSPSPTAPESPDPTAVESGEVFRPTAQQIIDDPKSQLVDVQSAPGDPKTRAALWRWCASEACRTRRVAVIVTTDGFESATVGDATWTNASVRIAANGDTVVFGYGTTQRIEVVRQDGSVAEAALAWTPSPVRSGEVVAGLQFRPSRKIFWATDTKSLTAHAVSVPDDTYELEQTDGGQLRAMSGSGRYAWSDDGGATWNESPGALSETLLPRFVASLDDTHVVVGGSDGATMFPFSEIRRLDAEDKVTEPTTEPTAYIGPAAVLPDGRFLVLVEAWSDWRFQQPLKGTPPGLYLSDGGDWSTYERIESGAPFDTPQAMQPQVTNISVGEDKAVITAIGPDNSSAWTSADLGVTWREMRVR